jgi:hypothetical protein
MVRVDFGESEHGPTLWIFIDSAESHNRLCDLLLRLFEGGLEQVACGDEQDFTLLPPVANLLLIAEPPGCGNEVDVVTAGPQHEFHWKLSRTQWLEVMYNLEELSPRSNHYFEYPNLTISIGLARTRSAPP